MENSNIFSRNLQRLLKKNGMTQRELAEALDFSESAVGKWILCRNDPTLANVQKIADFFNVSMNDLLNNENFYYLDNETRESADMLLNTPTLKALLKAAREVSSEDVEIATEMLKRMKKEERGEDES